jgi:hypothetical protein
MRATSSALPTEISKFMPSILQPLRQQRRSDFRARQAEVFAQGLALVLGAEQAAPLQLGHDLVHEVVETARQVGEHDVEAVAASVTSHSSIVVGDHLRRADHGKPAIAAERLASLAHRQVLALGQRDHPLAAALALVGLGDFRQRPIGIELARIDAEAIESAAIPLSGWTRLSSFSALLLRLLERIADDGEGAGQDLDVVGVAADLRRGPFTSA